MKKLYYPLLIIVLLFSLCGCKKDVPKNTTSMVIPSSSPTVPVCVHQYTDADCITAKTCIYCGSTRGKALGHDFIEGFCTRCGEEDQSYVALEAVIWQTDTLSEDGNTLESISISFGSDGTAQIQVRLYGSFSSLDEALRDQYPPESLYDYSGVPYYFTGTSQSQKLQYVIDGSMITCTLTSNEEVMATLILERISGNQICVTFLEGDFGTLYLQVGDIFAGYTG